MIEGLDLNMIYKRLDIYTIQFPKRYFKKIRKLLNGIDLVVLNDTDTIMPIIGRFELNKYKL